MGASSGLCGPGVRPDHTPALDPRPPPGGSASLGLAMLVYQLRRSYLEQSRVSYLGADVRDKEAVAARLVRRKGPPWRLHVWLDGAVGSEHGRRR